MEITILRILILTDLLMLALAIIHLLRRRLPLFDSAAWLLLSLFLPLLGPFLTLAFLPQQPENKAESKSIGSVNKAK